MKFFSNHNFPYIRPQHMDHTDKLPLKSSQDDDISMGASSDDDNKIPHGISYNLHDIADAQNAQPNNNTHDFVDELLPFTLKLHACLDDARFQGFEQIISWETDSLFKVHDVDAFAKIIMPRYFKSQTKYKSFQRQLNLYEFERITSGVLKGAYMHELFRRGNRELSCRMKLRKIKGKRDSSGSRSPARKNSTDMNAELKGAPTTAPEVQEQEAEQQSPLPNRPRHRDNKKESSFEGRKFFPI